MEDDHIATLETYKRRLEKKRDVYQIKYKNNPDFIKKNRERANAHYHANKERQRALKLYRYYIKYKTLKEFIDYHPDKFLMISDKFTLDEIDALI